MSGIEELTARKNDFVALVGRCVNFQRNKWKISEIGIDWNLEELVYNKISFF